MRSCLKCCSAWVKYWRTLNSASREGRMCQGIGQATFKKKKKIFLGDPAPSLVFTNVPGKQCKIKHTFLFTVGDQAEAYRPCTACSTFGTAEKVLGWGVPQSQATDQLDPTLPPTTSCWIKMNQARLAFFFYGRGLKSAQGKGVTVCHWSLESLFCDSGGLRVARSIPGKNSATAGGWSFLYFKIVTVTLLWKKLLGGVKPILT